MGCPILLVRCDALDATFSRNCLNLFSKDFEKIFEMFLQVEKGETFRFRLPKLGENSQKDS